MWAAIWHEIWTSLAVIGIGCGIMTIGYIYNYFNEKSIHNKCEKYYLNNFGCTKEEYNAHGCIHRKYWNENN